ncbi:polysaccharide deacetylase family protein [Ornithinibacillus sp. 179-J 7C1 HS]|uniref:polysaccharide deacetylase family protein n=1 Tax=Ornithinibacillus sp. 179-J 7C1 HS TaxID=3142384 RepID=UPI0039A2F17C
MKQRKISMIIMVILIGLVGLLLFFTFSKSENDEDITKEPIDKGIETAKSAYPGVNIKTEVSDEETYNIAIHYPEFEDAQLNKEILEFIAETKDEFFLGVEDNKEFLDDRTASLNLSFDIYRVVENVYSIVFTNDSYFGGANGLQNSKVFIADTANHHFITQTDILRNDEQSKEEIYDRLVQEFESTEYRTYFFKEQLEEWIRDENNTFSNMYVTDKAVVFKFNKYEVTAGAAGSPEIAIPIKEIQEWITDEWREKLHLEDKTAEKVNPPEQNKGENPESELKEEVPVGKKRVALTFDDGPHPTNTEQILKLLDQHDAKATFFMLGNRVDFYPDIAKEVADAGHEIGNHTWSHKDLTTLGEAEMELEFQRTNEAVVHAIGKSPTVFRPPYGARNEQVDNVIDMPATLWTIDSLDWKSHDPDQVLSIVKENIQDGSIILMHDIHATTVEAVELVLNFLDEEGYEFVTVSNIN